MKFLATASAVLLLTAGSAFAQESGKVGLTMGAPSALGVIWHATDRIALVPKITFSTSANESRIDSDFTVNGVVVSTVTLTSESDSWTIAPGLDVRLYAARWDNVAAYIAPGVSYQRGSTTTTTSSTSPLGSPLSETRTYRNTGFDVRGVFGVQYTPHPRFGVYGEFGLRYAHSRQRLASEITSDATSSTSAIGAVFYF